MSSSPPERRLTRSTKARTALIVVVAAVFTIAILLLVDVVLPPGGGPGPLKISNLGQVQVTQLPVSRKARTWFSRIRQEGRDNPTLAYEVCLRNEESDVLVTFGTAHGSRPDHLVPIGADGKSVFFAVRAAGANNDELYKQEDGGTLNPVTTSDGKNILVLAASASGTGAYILGHVGNDMTVYFLADSTNQAAAMSGNVTANSVPNLALLATFSDGFAFGFPNVAGGQTIRRVKGPTTHDHADLGAVDDITATGDKLHATVAGTRQLFYLPWQSGKQPVKATPSGDLVYVAAVEPAATGPKLLVVAFSGLLERVYSVTDATATELKFDGSPSDLDLEDIAVSNGVLWVIGKTGGKSFLWQHGGGLFKPTFTIGAIDTELLSPWNSGVVHAAGTWLLRYNDTGGLVDKAQLPAGALANMKVWEVVWPSGNKVYAVGDMNGGVGSADHALYSW